MLKLNKKGFTIVELVIVIAVVAILAAVLIPTFVGLTRAANASADIQACRQMNTQLAINEVTKGKTIVDVYAALKEGGMDAEHYTPLVEGTYFFWDVKLNRVLYADKDYNVIYPEEYSTIKDGKDGHVFLSLNASIAGADYESTANDDGSLTIKVSTAAQLYKAIQDLQETKYEIRLKGTLGNEGYIGSYFSHSITQNTTIELTKDINFKGAAFSIGAVSEGISLTIDGQGHTITGITNLDEAISKAKLNAEGEERNYYSGIIKFVDKNAKVTIKDITFNYVTTGRADVGSSGILIGNMQSGATAVFENVKITNSTLYGKNKLGAFVGAQYSGGCDVSIKGDTRLENVNIISSEGEAGILFGSTNNGGGNSKFSPKLDKKLFEGNGEIKFIKNCSVVCVSTDVKVLTAPEGFNPTLDGKAVKKTNRNEYRVTTAYLGFAGTADKYPETASQFNPINDYTQAVAAGWIYDFSGNKQVGQ